MSSGSSSYSGVSNSPTPPPPSPNNPKHPQPSEPLSLNGNSYLPNAYIEQTYPSPGSAFIGDTSSFSGALPVLQSPFFSGTTESDRVQMQSSTSVAIFNQNQHRAFLNSNGPGSFIPIGFGFNPASSTWNQFVGGYQQVFTWNQFRPAQEYQFVPGHPYRPSPIIIEEVKEEDEQDQNPNRSNVDIQEVQQQIPDQVNPSIHREHIPLGDNREEEGEQGNSFSEATFVGNFIAGDESYDTDDNGSGFVEVVDQINPNLPDNSAFDHYKHVKNLHTELRKVREEIRSLVPRLVEIAPKYECTWSKEWKRYRGVLQQGTQVASLLQNAIEAALLTNHVCIRNEEDLLAYNDLLERGYHPEVVYCSIALVDSLPSEWDIAVYPIPV